MMITLSRRLRDAIVKAQHDAARSGTILDAYKIAVEVQRVLPEESMALEDIIAALVIHNRRFAAVEFNPRDMILEGVISAREDDGEIIQEDPLPVAA
jgi:hypothetical protein